MTSARRKRLLFRDLEKFRGRRKAAERRCGQGVGVRETGRGIINSCQIECCAQLKASRLLLLCDRECSEERILSRRRIARSRLSRISPRQRSRKASLQCSAVSPVRASASSMRFKAPAISALSWTGSGGLTMFQERAPLADIRGNPKSARLSCSTSASHWPQCDCATDVDPERVQRRSRD
jgi:hypothetical protein